MKLMTNLYMSFKYSLYYSVHQGQRSNTCTSHISTETENTRILHRNSREKDYNIEMENSTAVWVKYKKQWLKLKICHWEFFRRK